MKILQRIGLCFSLFFDLFKGFWQLLYGVWRISKLPHPIVSIFGGARLKKEDPYFSQAFELGKKFVEDDISVLTGGGPGVMEAANCGAAQAGANGRSIGISVSNLGEAHNTCAQEAFEVNYFFARKWLLTHYSAAFIIFPGGFGTLDELAEVLTMIKTKKMPRVPIILFGVEYWKPFVYWVEHEAIKHGLIDKQDLKLFTLTDDLDQAFCVVRDECELPTEKKSDRA